MGANDVTIPRETRVTWPSAATLPLTALALALLFPGWANANAVAGSMTGDAPGDAIIVTADSDPGGNTLPAAKLPLSVHDLPVTIDRVTSAILADRAIVSVDEALDTVAGVRLAPSFPGAGGFIVRGFAESYNVYVDGFRDEQAIIDPQAIDHIDVLKGPPSIQFGANSAGGVVDLVSKLPQATPFATFEVLGGSFAERRFTGDINQPVAGGDVLLRINAAWDDADSFRQFVSSSTRTIAPSLTWKASPADTLTVWGSYMRNNFTGYSDFPIAPQFLTVPVSLSLSEPNLPQNRTQEFRAAYAFTHDFGHGWRLRSALGFNRSNVDYGLSRVYYPTLDADGQTLDRTGALEAGPQLAQALTMQEELYWQGQTGPIGHNLVLGFEYYKEKFQYLDLTADLPPLDIFAPVYNAQPDAPQFAYAGGSGDHNYAGYFQDMMAWGAHWRLMTGVRLDHNVAYANFSDAFGDTSSSAGTASHVSPRAGLIYQVRPATNLYLSWSRSFMPQVSYIAANGAVVPPALGEQFEAGIKQDLFGRRLSLTAAVYHIARRNVAVTDPQNPMFALAADAQRSQGAEVALAGQLTRNWNITASYAYTDAKVTFDAPQPGSPSLTGDALPGVPKNAFSMWTRYDLDRGPLAGAGAGLGVTSAEARPSALPSSFALPAYTRIDAQATYRLGHHARLSVNIKNLTNVRYYDTDTAYVLRPGAPRTVLASLRVDL